MTCPQSWECVSSQVEACVMALSKANLRVAFKAKRVAPWFPFWNARIHTAVLAKPAQAPEMSESDLDQAGEQPVFHCWQGLPVFLSFQSREPETPESSKQAVRRGQMIFKSLRCFCFGHQTVDLGEGPALCPTLEISFQFICQQDRK